MGSLLGAFGREVIKQRCVWLPIEPEIIHDLDRLLRATSYVFLNPCRAGLVTDPLSWPPSSYRDVIGAIAEPHLTAQQLADMLHLEYSSDFVPRFHQFLSDDHSVQVGGSPPPSPDPHGEHDRIDLDQIARGAAAATRGRPEDIRRRGATRQLFLHCAWAEGWRDTTLLGNLTALHPDSVTRAIRRGVPREWHIAGRLGTHDPRLNSYEAPAKKRQP
jgi:hypothetical protein